MKIIIVFIIGLILGFVFKSIVITNRYSVSSSANGLMTIKIDKLTGKSWRLNFLSDEWQELKNSKPAATTSDIESLLEPKRELTLDSIFKEDLSTKERHVFNTRTELDSALGVK
jgi:hypothetical protein